jgi:hypothetical protein
MSQTSGVSPAHAAACAVAAKVSGHQRQRTLFRVQPARPHPRRVADREHQPQRGVADREAGAVAAEQLFGDPGLERANLWAVVAEHARRLDPAQRIEVFAQTGRVRRDQGEAYYRRSGLLCRRPRRTAS